MGRIGEAIRVYRQVTKRVGVLGIGGIPRWARRDNRLDEAEPISDRAEY